MIVSVPSAGHIRYEFPNQKQIDEGPTDGTASPVQGPSAPEGATIAYKQLSANKLSWSFASKGTVLGKGVDTISADGKTLTSVSWAPGKAKEKTVEVYDKQS